MLNLNDIYFICLTSMIVAFICHYVHQIDDDHTVCKAAWWIGLLALFVGLIFACMGMSCTG